MKVGEKVYWYDPAILDYPENERETQRNRVYTIVKFIGEDMCLIADEYGEVEVPLMQIEYVPIANLYRSFNALRDSAREKLKEVGTITFNYNEDEYGSDERPQVIIADKHCEIAWEIVLSVSWSEERKEIMLQTENYGEVYASYCEALSEQYVYSAILYA